MTVYIPGRIVGVTSSEFPELFVQGRPVLDIDDNGNVEIFYISEHPPIPEWENEIIVLDHPGIDCDLQRMVDGTVRIDCTAIQTTTITTTTSATSKVPTLAPTTSKHHTNCAFFILWP